MKKYFNYEIVSFFCIIFDVKEIESLFDLVNIILKRINFNLENNILEITKAKQYLKIVYD